MTVLRGQQVTGRWVARLTLVALTASLLAAWPAISPGSGASASPASTREIDLVDWRESGGAARDGLENALSAQSLAGDAADDAAWFVTDELPVDDTVMVGVELPDDEQPPVEVRTRVAGEWSEWTLAEFPHEEDGPDPGTQEADEARNTTEPVWFGEADSLQVRVAGTRAPSAAKLHAVDIDGSLDYDPATAQSGAADAAPNVISRRQWDPNNECKPRRSASVASSARFTVIHHTAGTNNYSRSQAVAQLRGICLYHRNALGWNDIGYNVVVDRYGRVYEGRAGGLHRAVIGAHAANYNTGSFGVSVMGCFDRGCSSSMGSSGLPSAALRAVDEVVAWKFAIHGIDPYDRIRYRNGNGSTVTLDTIVGHRDVGTTSCPGSNFAPYVRGSRPMKHRVAPLIDEMTPPWQDAQGGNFTTSGRGDLTTFNPATGDHLAQRSTGSNFAEESWTRWRTRSGWQRHLVGNFLRGRQDQTASFHTGTGNWVVNRHDGNKFVNSVWTSYRTTKGWRTHLAGDFDGNGQDDIVSFHGGTGNWVVSTSNGLSLGSPRVWSKFSTTRGWQTHLVGDFTGDRLDDILSYHPGTGNWMLQRSTGLGFEIERWTRFGTTKGWRTHLAGDFTGDGRQEVASYHNGSRNWVVSRFSGGVVSGLLNTGSVVSEVWDKMPTSNGWTAHVVGDVTGNGRDDLVSANSTAPSLWINRSNGSSFGGGRLAKMHDPGVWENHVLLDATGDGKQEVASYHGRQNSWWVTDTDGDTSRWR